MEEKRNYEILKFVMHGDKCYMSTDIVKGKPLIVWLKYHAHITKEQFYEWARQIIADLDHFHRCRGNPCYQYVNPYSVIVGEDRKVYLLDLASKEQEDMMHLMQRRYVRENFLSPENQYYQKSEEKEDIYGFGKMIQYVLSSVELEPELKFLESVRIQKIITRCLDKQGKKRYQKLSDLSGQFSLSEKRNGSKKIMYVMIALAVIGLLVLSGNRIVSCISGQSRRQGGQDTKLADTERKEDMKAQAYQEQFQELKEQWETERKELQDESSKREQELLYDLAFVYFSQMKDYEVCSRYLEEMKEPDAFAKDMVRLCGMMSRADGEDDNTEKRTEDEEESVEMLLERMRQEIPDEEDERYAECIEFAKEQLQKEDVVEKQTSGEES
ncbi:hypothetical protein [Dorea ammoniilytica]|mgnify:FL=1|uniref:Protein kinase domain-containing protein n=1 Tax=Dorea ammoniilytica TaxID=2981788 RepID=A0ABT2S511_9FIRM|nr:hypothetical protein [Dorea ammoniilytica]MCU6699671.1 hypothetical protein [Dorea ammoniilytica]SCH43787.1 Uncharacterised protein [uncultured Eubacterium sp.]